MPAHSGQTCSYCDKPAVRGELCWAHDKRKRLGRPMVTEDDVYGSPTERHQRAAIDFADVDSDDDDAFARAADNLRKAGEASFRRSFSESVQRGLAAAKARGVRLGRPPSKDDQEIADVVEAVGGIKRAARLLRVSRGLVRRALVRVRRGKFEGSGK